MCRSVFTAARSILVAALATSCTAESPPAGPSAAAIGVVFLTQSEPQTSSMDALFRGRVMLDAAQCTRLGGPDGATVIWPRGFTASRDGGAIRVHDPSGTAVGRLGDAFRISGGEVEVLLPALHISYWDRAWAQEFCPGRYWIAGTVEPSDAR